jgi:hypothetical protein
MCPVLRICDQPTFENANLSEFYFAISIQGKGSYPAVLRLDFRGQRLNILEALGKAKEEASRAQCDGADLS